MTVVAAVVKPNQPAIPPADVVLVTTTGSVATVIEPMKNLQVSPSLQSIRLSFYLFLQVKFFTLHKIVQFI